MSQLRGLDNTKTQLFKNMAIYMSKNVITGFPNLLISWSNSQVFDENFACDVEKQSQILTST